MYLKRQDPYALVKSMTAVKMGDRVVQVGCAHGGRLGAVAVKVGLSGRAVAIVPDEPSAERARKGAAAAGALLSRAQSGPPFAASGDAGRALQADGFKSVRTLAEREGLVFVEGLKGRT